MPEADSQIEDELVRLMNQHERPIYNFLLSLVRDSDAALDCAQDTFLRAFQNLRQGKPVNARSQGDNYIVEIGSGSYSFEVR